MTFRATSHSMRRAFTLLELLCTMAIIGILTALLLPVIQQSYARAKRAACANNLINIGVAAAAWAHDHNDQFPMQVPVSQGGTREFAEATALNPDVSFNFRHFQAISNELATPWVLRCPAEKFRARAENFAALSNQNISYWLNTAAAPGRHDSPLAGDRNVRTSGRTAWTFLQIGTGDAVEFSAEIHGHRGNILFGDGHVDDLDSRALRAAFAAATVSNLDLTLALPQGESGDGTAPSSSAAASAPMPPAPTAAPNPGSTTSTATKSPTNSAPSASLPSFPNRPASPGTRGTADERSVLVTRLDGTVVTSNVPRRVTSVMGAADPRSSVESGTASPLIEFVQWLTRVAARGTYWLLFLLLLALLAFEFARRRARRKRRPAR